jgi:hypothetical protein
VTARTFVTLALAAATFALAGCETTAPYEDVPEGGALPPAYYGDTPPPVYYGPPPVVYYEYWHDPFWPRGFHRGDIIVIDPGPRTPPPRRPAPIGVPPAAGGGGGSSPPRRPPPRLP